MLLLQCASVIKPAFTHPLPGASLHPTQEPLKFDTFISSSSSTLPTLNAGFSIRVSITPHSVRIHSWNPISSSSIRKWMWSFLSIGPLLRLSRVILIFLLALILEGEACGSPVPAPFYSCQEVQSYYSTAEHKKGEALKKALHVIVARHQSLSYKEVWDALKILDASEVNDPEASSGIVEIYSLRVVSKQLAGKPEGWNNVNVNSSRGNKYFGECCIGSIDCMKPANKEAASDTETDKEKWAPPKQVRGDIARALMYMAVRYGFQEPGFPVLNLSDSPSTKTREMGLLSTLLKWNEMDPPSREEKLRNDRICRIYQHNRNPFVDHPEYAKVIWKQGNPSCQRLRMPLKQRIQKP